MKKLKVLAVSIIAGLSVNLSATTNGVEIATTNKVSDSSTLRFLIEEQKLEKQIAAPKKKAPAVREDVEDKKNELRIKRNIK